MKGQILDFSIQTNTGYISGDDGKRYHFSGQEWKDNKAPNKGMNVDFDVNNNNEAIAIFVLASNKNPITSHQQTGNKSRIVAAILAFFLGGLGIHKFYLGQIGWGIIYLIFCWTFIPSIVAFIEFIIYLCTSDEDFAKKYG
jgi:TM2 domain-containing membrane protein YozV